MKTETKEKLTSIKNKAIELVKKPGKKGLAIICAVLLIGGAIAVNLALFSDGGAGGEKTEKTGLAVDLTSLKDPENVESRDTEKTDADPNEDYYSTVSLGRKQARDEAMEVLLSVSESADALPDAKAEAMNDMNRIALDIEHEAQIETLVISRGFKNCVAVVNGDTASVIVDSDPLTPGQAAQVSEIVYEAAGIIPANLKIIEKKTG
ncbi:MAG: SpoIIIAH-like family protein [Clostridia bacterium]|nr:SpoIIIAH-like family protein [Clostridia bacterium]